MSTKEIIILFVVFFLLLALLLFLRCKISRKITPTTADLLVAIAPVALWLLFSGKLTKLEWAGVKFETLFQQAKNALITDYVEPLPIENPTTTLKSGVDQIDNIVAQQYESVTLLVGYDNYSGDAIEEYLRKLNPAFVSYFVFLTDSSPRKFVGVISFRDISRNLLSPNSDLSPNDLAQWLREGDQTKFAQLRDIILYEDAVSEKSTKEHALEKMLALEKSFLPVIGDQRSFEGLVTKSGLSSSIIIDLSRKINANSERQ